MLCTYPKVLASPRAFFLPYLRYAFNHDLFNSGLTGSQTANNVICLLAMKAEAKAVNLSVVL
jgi:hypothetical protein